MDEEFYAVLKLVSGEEIFSKISYADEDDRVLVILDYPITIETVVIPKVNVPVAKVQPWIKLSEDTMYIMTLDKIITMTECDDNTLIMMHKKYVKEFNKRSNGIDDTNEIKITENMGYVSTVSDARISLEKLYHSSTSNNTFE